MATQQVVRFMCDRCKRAELVAPESVKQKSEPDFEARLGETKLVFQDLCPKCTQALKNIWVDLEEWDRQVKPAFTGPTIPGNTAPPLTVAPDYTPPKPHSGAAGKK